MPGDGSKDEDDDDNAILTVGNNIDCVVSAWVLGSCNDGTRVDTRTIITQPSGSGIACPVRSRTRTCIEDVYDLALRKVDPT